MKHRHLAPRSLCSVYSNGELYLSFLWLNRTPREEELRDRFKKLVSDRTGFRVPDNYRQRQVLVPLREWVPETSTLLKVLEELVAEFHEGAA